MGVLVAQVQGTLVADAATAGEVEVTELPHVA